MILGIDPGINNIGIAFLEHSPSLHIKESYLYTIPKPEHIGYIEFSEYFTQLTSRDLQFVGIEKPFFTPMTLANNIRTLEVIGLMKYILYCNGHTNITMLSPATIKKTATGNGRAKKPEIITAMETMFSIDLKNNSHIADALACGIAAYTQGMVLGECKVKKTKGTKRRKMIE
jgi:Holliday junction resolvasome RuvABC endonuclease subunit